MGPRFDIYVRVSRVGKRSGDSYTTVEEQERSCREYAKRHGFEVGLVVTEEDVSGGKRIKDRQLDTLVQRVENGESAGIIAFNVKRFARSVAEGSLAINRIKAAGAEFHDSFGNNTRDNSLAINIYLAIGEDELEKLTEQWGRSRERAIEAGKFIGPTPLGYVRVDGRLVEDPFDGPRVRRLFTIAASEGLHAAIGFARETWPARSWTTSDTRKILGNRRYLGECKHGKHVNPAAHEPLVSASDFTLAQTAPAQRRRNSDYPLSGLAVCGECGGPLHGQLQSFANRPQTYRRYRCPSTTCNGGSSINADTLEVYVREAIAELLGNRRVREQYGAGDLEGAQAALDRALAAELAYHVGTAEQELEPSVVAAGAAAHKRRVVAARERLVEVSSRAAINADLPQAAMVLEDDEVFALALRTMLVSVRVARGRGSVGDRVGPDGIVWWHPGENVVGAAAA